uniref:HTH_48 domain-containing protein n=1 Tax=Heterorhabditis bacteriophora TaxID=37862 RepID=A0A1I7WAF2_HETBA
MKNNNNKNTFKMKEVTTLEIQGFLGIQTQSTIINRTRIALTEEECRGDTRKRKDTRSRIGRIQTTH